MRDRLGIELEVQIDGYWISVKELYIDLPLKEAELLKEFLENDKY